MNKLTNFFKDTKKRTIGIIALVCAIVISITLVLNYTFSIINTSNFYEAELKNFKTDAITISNIKMNEENGVTTYKADINASEETNIKYIKIILKDESNNEIVTLIGYVGSLIQKNTNKKIEASTDADLSKIKSIEYEIIQ